MDTNVLLGAQGVQMPDMLGAAGKGLTLADLLTRTQAGQMALETQRQRAAFYGGPDAAALWNSGASSGPGGAPGAPDMSSISKYGLAAPGIVEDYLKMQKQTSDIAESRAKALEANTKAMKDKVGIMSDYAMKAAEKPTPGNIQGYLRQHQMTGLPPDFFGQMPPLGSSPEAWQTYLGGVASASQSAEAQLAIARQAVMLPLEQRASRATSGKTELETSQMPAELAVKQRDSNTKAFEATTVRFNAEKPALYFPPGTNTPYSSQATVGGGLQVNPLGATPSGGVGQPTPQNGPGGPGMGAGGQGGQPRAQNAPGVVPAGPAAPPAGPVTLGQTPAGLKLGEAAGGKVADMIDTLPTIYSAMTRFNALKEQIENDKLLNGPLMGQDGVKKIMGEVSQLPGMPPALRQAVANTQVFDATALSGVFNLMGEGKGTLPRSTAALDMLISAKPGTIQYKEAMLSLTNALLADLSTRVQMITNMSRKVSAGGVPGAADFPSQPGAPRQIDALTPQSAAENPNVTVQGPTGTHKSDGSTWVRIGPPPGR